MSILSGYVRALRAWAVGTTPELSLDPSTGALWTAPARGVPSSPTAVTVTQAGAALAASSTPILGGLVQADRANSESIFVGAAGVTTATGIELVPGATLDLAGVADLSALHAIRASATGACSLRLLPLLPP
jgi:hypothetical protein